MVTIAVVGVPATPTAGIDVVGSVPVGPWRIGVTVESLTQALRVLSVSMGCVASTLFLALTTPIVDLTDQLRRWHVPALFIELMVLIYRFTFVLLETAQAMYTAQDARLGYSSMRRSLRSIGMLASNLYLRAQARATALFTALTARGYTGELRVLTTEPVWSTRHLVMIALADGLLAGLAIAMRLGGMA